LRQHPYKKSPRVLAKNQLQNFNNDLNSPEGTGIANTNTTRPVGSPEAFINNFYNSPNISITTKNLFPHVKFKFYNYNSNTILQKEAAETAKKQVLVPFLDPETTPVNFSMYFHL
jgi:hypothetical protein